MSFGIGVGDIIACSKIAAATYNALKEAPSEFEGLRLEVLSLNATLRALAEEANAPTSIILLATSQRQESLRVLIENCTRGLQQLEQLTSKYSRLGTNDRSRFIEHVRFASTSKQGPRDKLAIHTASINIFLTSLTHSSLGRLESLMKETMLHLKPPSDGFSSIWSEIGRDLASSGVATKDITRHRKLIIEYVKDLAQNESGRPRYDSRPSYQSDSNPYSSGHGVQTSSPPPTYDHNIRYEHETSQAPPAPQAPQAPQAPPVPQVPAAPQWKPAFEGSTPVPDNANSHPPSNQGPEFHEMPGSLPDTANPQQGSAPVGPPKPDANSRPPPSSIPPYSPSYGGSFGGSTTTSPPSAEQPYGSPSVPPPPVFGVPQSGVPPPRPSPGGAVFGNVGGTPSSGFGAPPGSSQTGGSNLFGHTQPKDEVDDLVNLFDHMFDVDDTAIASVEAPISPPIVAYQRPTSSYQNPAVLPSAPTQPYSPPASGEVNLSPSRPESSGGTLSNLVSPYVPNPIKPNASDNNNAPPTLPPPLSPEGSIPSLASHYAGKRLLDSMRALLTAQGPSASPEVANFWRSQVFNDVKRIRDMGFGVIQCDRCSIPIEDNHYHCDVCENGDYDICERCNAHEKGCPIAWHFLKRMSAKSRYPGKYWTEA